jgi:hypothetical protein
MPPLALWGPIEAAHGAWSGFLGVAEAAFGPAWLGYALLVIGILFLLGLGRIATLLTGLTEAQSKLDIRPALADIQAQLNKMREDRDDLDLRRLEHVLVDIRDGNKRLEEKLTLTIEHAATVKQVETEVQRPPNMQPGLGERIVNRLLALGYSQVQIVPPGVESAELSAEDGTGEVILEARRDGAHFKGRVLLQNGAISDVMMTPAYDMFP